MASTVVSAGQTLEIAGLVSSGTPVGSLLIASGVTTSNAVISYSSVDDQGAISVSSGGVISGYSVDDAATMTVSSGGSALVGEIASSGVVSVAIGATVSGLDVASGGELELGELVVGSGSSFAFTPAQTGVNAGAPLSIGGASIETGGVLFVQSVSVASDASLTLDGGYLNAPSLVEAGGLLTIDSGAQLSGGGEILGSAVDLGTVKGIAVGSGGVLAIDSSGEGQAEEVDSGGLIIVSSGGTLSGAAVLPQGGIEFAPGAIVSAAQMDPGATLFFAGDANAATLSGGELVLTSNGVGVAQVGIAPVFVGERFIAQYQGDGQTNVLARGEARDDFLGTQQSDLLMQNAAGAVVADVLSGGAETYQQLGGLGPEWRFLGNDDFLGEGHAQSLIENTAGAVVLADDQGGQFAYTDITGLGPEWSFVGIGDFLGDGKQQFLIENSAGSVVAGEISSGGGGDTVAFTLIGGLGSEWSFKGTGDFLGDGQDQFLIENSNGALVVGEADPTSNGGFQANYAVVGGLGPEWSFVGTGDFLGNGKTEFLLENTAGALVAGQISNFQAQYLYLGGLGPEWSFVGTGDYSGTGTDSFMLRNTNGALVTGALGSGGVTYAAVGGVGSEWNFHP